MSTTFTNSLTSGKQAYYPHLDDSTPLVIREALRRAFDNIYQISGQLLPIGTYVLGRDTIAVPVSPERANVPNVTLTLARAGLWSITGVFSVQVIDAGDIGSLFTGSLVVSGIKNPSNNLVQSLVTQPGAAKLLVQAQPETHTISQTWQVRTQANGTAKLVIEKDVGTGTSIVDGRNSSILAVWCGL